MLIPLTSMVLAQTNDISQFDLPEPIAPDYFIFETDDGEESNDRLTMIKVADQSVVELSSQYYDDSDTFYAKYGLYYFNIVMQYDVSLDGEDNWQYTEEWDTQYNVGSYGEGFGHQSVTNELMETHEFFWFVYHGGQGSDTFVPYQPAIIVRHHSNGEYDWETYHFDTENHSLYIRCRYYMEWQTFDAENNEIGEKQSKFSDWSESAIFGKNTTQKIPEKPTVYVAPTISDLEIVADYFHGNGYVLEYVQTTPRSVWEANIYYLMTDDGYFDGLETQVSINNGDWIEFSTANAGGNWCLWNGLRTAIPFDENITIEENSNVKLRVRFLGSDGPSEWSNVLEINSKADPIEPNPPVDNPNQQQPTPPDEGNVNQENCSLCGFCSMPLDICILIWIAIIMVIVITVIVIISKGKKKCPSCGNSCNKKDEKCNRCGLSLK